MPCEYHCSHPVIALLEAYNAGTISVGVSLFFMNPISTIYTAWIIDTISRRIST